MLTLRRSADRGYFDHGWLQTFHTFSFGDYYDPDHTQFGALRVMNEDTVAPGQGFGMHGHSDMEIVTYVLEGALQHRDSLGNGEVLRPGEFQRMTAGSGVRHSEFNPSATEPVHLYQIWLLPDARGLTPEYEQKPFPEEGRRGKWQQVASKDGADGSLRIHQDARLFLATLDPGQSLNYTLAEGRSAWLQTLRGDVVLNGTRLTAGDGAALREEPSLAVSADKKAEVLLFDLA